MKPSQIKLTIDSDFENVFLISQIIRTLCASIPFSDIESEQVELCLVEAVNNSIEHAYGKQPGYDVEIIVTLDQKRLLLEVCDVGKPMDENRLERIDMSLEDYNLEDFDSIPEEGRGLPIMKAIMDSVSYETQNGRNCLTMIKEKGKFKV